MIQHGHTLAECGEMTLAQVLALTAGHQEVDALREHRLAIVMHHANQGSSKELRAFLDQNKRPSATEVVRGDYDGALNQL